LTPAKENTVDETARFAAALAITTGDFSI